MTQIIAEREGGRKKERNRTEKQNERQKEASRGRLWRKTKDDNLKIIGNQFDIFVSVVRHRH